MTHLAFTMDAKDLRALTSQALRTVSRRGIVQVLSGVQLTTTTSKLIAVTTDLDYGQRITVDAKATPGSVLIPAKQFDTIVSTFEGEVTVEDIGEHRVAVKQGRTSVSLETMTLEDFPRLPEVKRTAKAVVVMGDDFTGPYKFVRTASSQDESRPVLVGILLEPRDKRLGMAATDSYRLAYSWAEAACTTKTWGKLKQAIIRSTHLDEVSRLLKDPLSFTEIRVVDDKWLCFTVGNIDLYSRKIDGAFPDIPKLLPERYEEEFEIDRPALVKSLTRVEKLARARNTPTKLIFFEKGEDGQPVEDELTVFHKEQDSHVLTDKVPMRILIGQPNGGRDEIQFGINVVFAKEAAAAFSTDDITLCMINPLRPVLFRSERDDEGFLVMPVRLV